MDALGTLVELVPPAPTLAVALARAGFPQPDGSVDEAIAAEIAYYRAHMQRGRDAESLAELRRDCARVLAAHLPEPRPPIPELADLLVSSLVFRVHADAIPMLDALRMARVPVVVLSNWDCSLPGTLEDLGLAHYVELILTSAQIGSQKPEAEAFARAVEHFALDADQVLHVGDDAHRDAQGAHSAGLRAVHLDRSGTGPGGPWTTVRSLLDVVPLAVA